MSNERIEKHEEVILEMHETYLSKNADYGNSFTKVRNKFPLAILVRLSDKYNRLETLMVTGGQNVLDESIDDTLLDLANYCVLELIERRLESEALIRQQIELERELCDANPSLKGSGTNVRAFTRPHRV